MTIFKVVNGALPTSGTTDLTVTGFGVPKAVVLFVSGATADATRTAHTVLGIGAMDDTTQGSVSFTAQDVVATSNTNRTLYANLASGADPTAAATLDWDIDGALIADGVRLSIVNAPAGAYRCTALLIGNVDQAEVVIHDDLGAASGDQAVTLSKTWSKAPNLLIGFTQNGNVAPDTVAANGALSFGFSDFTNHRGVSIGGVDAAAGEYMTALISNTSMLAQAFNATVAWEGSPNTPTTSNFQVNLSASSGNDIAVFLALRIPDNYAVSIDDFTVPSGDSSTFSTSVTPVYNLALTCEGPTAYGTEVTTSDVGFGITSYDGDNIGCITGSVTDAAAKSQHSDSLNIMNSAGSASAVVGTPLITGRQVKWLNTTGPSADLLGVSLSVGRIGSGGPIFEDEEEETRRRALEDSVLGFGTEADNIGINYELDK